MIYVSGYTILEDHTVIVSAKLDYYMVKTHNLDSTYLLYQQYEIPYSIFKENENFTPHKTYLNEEAFKHMTLCGICNDCGFYIGEMNKCNLVFKGSKDYMYNKSCKYKIELYDFEGDLL